ncbi:MAG: major capsid protein P2 [Opitutaceae bacterium]|jgi:hypothetical protein
MATPRFNDQVSGISGVAAGGIALLPIPTELRLISTQLCPSGTFVVGGVPTAVARPSRAQLAALIDLIQVEVNSDTIREMTVDELIDENEANGIPFQAGFLQVFMMEPKRATVSGEEALAWPLYRNPWGVNSCRIKVKFNAAAAAPALTASYEYDLDPQVNSKGSAYANITFWKRHTVQVAGAGTIDKNDLDVDGQIQRITVRSANVTKIVAKVGSRTIHDRVLDENAASLKPYEVTQQANTYALYFDKSQIVDNGVDTGGRPLLLKLTYSGAGDHIALQQIIKPKFF